MTTATLSPEDRVRLVVGGRLTPDAVGQQAYDELHAAINADPAAHLAAFERLFLTNRPSRRAITELHLGSFLARMRSHLPEAAEAAARRLDALMASLERRQAAEAEEVGETSTGAAAAEIARQRRQLARRRGELAHALRAR